MTALFVLCCTAGGLCALCGTAVFLAGTGTWFFASWYVVAALLIGAGWMARAGIISAWPAPEAEVMAAYLVDRGIDPKRIVLEGESVNTVGNLKNCMSLMGGARSFGIVTNDFHVYHSVAIARKLGAQGACGISAPSNPFFLPNNMMRESLGIAKDFAFGNI